MSHGGFTKSNYTASEVAESDFDTHSQFQQKRKPWGQPLGQDDHQDVFGGGIKISGGGDLAGITDIGVLNIEGSRRGSFRAPSNDRGSSAAGGRGLSESKDRMREPSGATNYGVGLGSQKPVQSFDNQLGLRRP